MQARRRLPNILVLSIDIGTSVTRSALFDENANRLESTSSSQPHRVCHTSDGGAELPFQVVLRAAIFCIAAVGCSGFWHSLLGVDRRGAPLTPIYTWGDALCATDAARFRQAFEERTISSVHWLHAARLFLTSETLLAAPDRATNVFSSRSLDFARGVCYREIFSADGCNHSMASGTGIASCPRDIGISRNALGVRRGFRKFDRHRYRNAARQSMRLKIRPHDPRTDKNKMCPTRSWYCGKSSRTTKPAGRDGAVTKFPRRVKGMLLHQSRSSALSQPRMRSCLVLSPERSKIKRRFASIRMKIKRGAAGAK